MRKNIDEFIENHNFINYCEAVIYIDGKIEYVNPSHVELMIKESNNTKEEIYKMMDIWESPIDWLINFTNIVCVWANGYILPKNISNKQKYSLDLLIENNLVKPNNFRC